MDPQREEKTKKFEEAPEPQLLHLPGEVALRRPQRHQRREEQRLHQVLPRAVHRAPAHLSHVLKNPGR